jgi:hypothetical protein
MLPSTDQVERIGIHDFQGAGPECQEPRHGLPDLFETSKMNERGQRGLGLVDQRESGFTDYAQSPLAADE